jgi:5,10-methylenetetrahydromethanopterin reductase
MDFGIQLATSSHSWKVVKRAEELGFTSAWFYDTELLNAEVFVAMGAAAVQTSKIRLGTGVLIPSNRIAPVTASGLASLNALAPGRIDFGVSTGFTGRRTVGLPAIKQARMEEYIRVVQGLLAGETVEWSEEGGPHKIRFLNPELELVNIKDPIPTYISAFGPRGRKLIARLGVGWITVMRSADAALAQLKLMRAEWAAAGRNEKDLHTVTFGSGCVLQEGEALDSPRVKAQAGPTAAIVFHNSVEEEEFGPMGYPTPPHLKANFDAYRKIYESYTPADARYLSNHRGHLMFLRPEEQPIITADVIRTLCFVGTQSQLVEQVKAVKAAGYNQFGVNIRTGHEMAMLEDWYGVISRV